MTAKFILDQHTGDIINMGYVAKLEYQAEGRYVALDVAGRKIGVLNEADVLPLTKHGTVITAVPGTKAYVIRCKVDWRQTRPTEKDCEVKEHDVVAWRITDTARPVFATAWGVDDDMVLVKKSNGEFYDGTDQIDFKKAKCDFLRHLQWAHDMSRPCPVEKLN